MAHIIGFIMVKTSFRLKSRRRFWRFLPSLEASRASNSTITLRIGTSIISSRTSWEHSRRFVSLRFAIYSHAGNVLFPRWEHFIPNVGIIWMGLFHNKRLQRNLKTLHPITWNIDKHKDHAGLGVCSTLTLWPNPTLPQAPPHSLILSVFSKRHPEKC